jgi:hypothetical protein
VINSRFFPEFKDAKKIVIRRIKGKLMPLWVKIYHKDGTIERKHWRELK